MGERAKSYQPFADLPPGQYEALKAAPWVLYAFYGDLFGEDTPLYVGISTNIEERVRYHQHSTEWWRFARRVMFLPLDDETRARAAEIVLIHGDAPLGNICFQNWPLHRERVIRWCWKAGLTAAETAEQLLTNATDIEASLRRQGPAA